MLFSKRLRRQEHTREFVVAPADDRGWEVREEADDCIIRREWLDSWDRVESEMLKFNASAARLEEAGWIDA